MAQLRALPKGSLEYAFSITHSVAFASYAADFLRERGMSEDASPRVIRGAVRSDFLGF